MPIAVFTLLLADLAAANPPAAAPHSSSGIVAVFDPGSNTCEESFRADNVVQTSGWINGFFTGRNLADKRTVGLSLQEAGLLAAIKAACASAPRQRLFDTTEREYEKLLASGG